MGTEFADETNRSGQRYFAPVALSIGVLAGLNALWNLPQLAGKAHAAHDVVVYLLGGSGLAIMLLRSALRDGRLTKRDIGLDSSGWRPLKRLIGVAMIVLIGYCAFANLEATLPPGFVDAAEQTVAADPDPDLTIVHKPTWGDLSFWFVLLLAASLAELLVFVGLGFCMVERGLRERGMGSRKATTLAAIFASVTFGLYHYTHEPSWWPMVFIPLMPVMMINVVCFILTRNFYLTLGLHGMFAALGMTIAQYMDPVTNNPALRQEPAIWGPTLVSFVIPFLVLHCIEFKRYRAS
jgi:membrane protease YdiL (CAAX protease family)